jgi:uncharacterized protein with ParB-like and HNH nuclease domain
MKATERTLQQLLHSSDQYVIPVFQRYYTWTTANWEQLLEDVGELLDAADDRRHFMGSIVTVPDGHQPGVVPAYQVIDGQQRLTTISILLCSVRDVALARGWNDLAAEVEENYLVHRFKKNRERYKLFPRLRDRGAYLALVDRAEQSQNGGQLEAAYRFLHKRVDQRATDEAELRRFFTAVVTRLDFVAITLGGENPYKIFRSLNSTGVDLTEADLIRNHVFMSLPVEEQDAFDDSLWKDLESRFVRDGKVSGRDFEAFLRDALMRDGTYVGRDGTFEDFERRYPYGKFEARAVVTELGKTSKIYDVVRGATVHSDGSVNAALRAIRDLNVTTAYPLVTTLLERHLRSELPKEDLISALRSIASFVLRRYVCGQSSRGYSTWFVAACRELGAEPAKSVLTFLRAKGWPSDDEFRVKFIRHNLYQSKYDRAVLGALELAIQAKSEPVLLDGCSIEHVMPQTIDEADDDGKAWIAVLGADWKQLHAEWLHTAGNLTLVGADYNAEMSNRAFELKKPVLGASKVYMNQHFKGDALKTWSQGEIEARAKLLADLAIKVWPAPPPSAAA